MRRGPLNTYACLCSGRISNPRLNPLESRLESYLKSRLDLLDRPQSWMLPCDRA